MEELNLLVCSDIHGSKKALKALRNAVEDDPFDAVVICGDLTTDGSPKFARALLDSLRTKVIAVPGNCDSKAVASLLDMAEASVHGKRGEVKGVKFFGFGGAPPSPYGTPFEIPEEVMALKLREVGVRGGVMVTHTPALGMNDRSASGHSMGSKAILDIASELRPRLALSGHVHEARGETVSRGTVFVNPGAAKDGYYAKVRLAQSVRVSLCSV
ncbi:MAG: metallophosphoesterase family protein [Methanobacteriota archaeon]|nr:MAG: metallophosphoesterase family protein [Euryarchaeota archaeon]